MNFPDRISDDNGPEWNDAPHDLTDEKHIEALQAENRRLREALERCRMSAIGDASDLAEIVRFRCEEALK